MNIEAEHEGAGMTYRNTSGLVPYQQQPDPSKLAARAAGQMKFQGSRCKYGHNGIRYTSTGQCVDCIPMYRQRDKEQTQ